MLRGVDTLIMSHPGSGQISSLLSAAGLWAATNSSHRLAPRLAAHVSKSERSGTSDANSERQSSEQLTQTETPLDSDSVSISKQAQEMQKEVARLQATDQKVRAHEQAHVSAAGGYAKGGASFSYTRGPDGKLYAVSGEVAIDTSPVPGDPDATIRKAQVVRRAAMAPANPSAQDRSVAAAASQMAQEAQTEKLEQSSDEKSVDADSSPWEASSATPSDGSSGSGRYHPVSGFTPARVPTMSLLDLLA